MSLEAELKAHAEALNKNTAAITAHTAALAGLAKGGATAAAPKANAGAAAGAKPAGAAAAKNTTKPAAPDIEEIKKRFGGYLSVKDADQREARKAHVAAINAHFGVDRATALDASLFAEALGYLAIYEAGGEPEFPAADETGGEEEAESLV